MYIMDHLSNVQLRYITNHVVNAVKTTKNAFIHGKLIKHCFTVIMHDGSYICVRCDPSNNKYYALPLNNGVKNAKTVGFESDSPIGALRNVTETVA